MATINNEYNRDQLSWQTYFVQILPEIEQRLRYAFRHSDPHQRDESTQDGIVHCLLAFVRLFQKGRMASAIPASLVFYAVLQVRSGRQAGYRLNVREPMSRYAQLRKGFQVESLQTDGESNGRWIDLLVEDKRSPVADQVVARMDIRAWIATLPQRSSQIAKDLAQGFTTSEVARKYRLSAGRISQVRRELEVSWRKFQHESSLAPAR